MCRIHIHIMIGSNASDSVIFNCMHSQLWGKSSDLTESLILYNVHTYLNLHIFLSSTGPKLRFPYCLPKHELSYTCLSEDIGQNFCKLKEMYRKFALSETLVIFIFCLVFFV